MMFEYHKIDSIFMRDPANRHKTFLMGQYARPEFELLKDCQWTFTEKVDGTNVRVYWDGQAIRFGGRSDNAQIPTFLYDKLNQRFTPELMLSVFGPQGGICLYGEGYGAKIQSGGNYIRDGVDFILFDIGAGDVWFTRGDCEEYAQKLDIGIVPIMGTGTLAEAIEKVSAGFMSPIGTAKSEGLVLRPTVELKDRIGRRIITKIKHKDFQ